MSRNGDIITAIGVVVGIVGLIAQLSAPKCPTCGTKLLIINNYCVNCKVSWKTPL